MAPALRRRFGWGVGHASQLRHAFAFLELWLEKLVKWHKENLGARDDLFKPRILRAIPPESAVLTPAMEWDQPVHIPAGEDPGPKMSMETNKIAVRVYFKVNGDTTTATHYVEALRVAGINLQVKLEWTRTSGSDALAGLFTKEPASALVEPFANLQINSAIRYLRYPQAAAGSDIKWTLTCTAELLYDGSTRMSASKESLISQSTGHYNKVWEKFSGETEAQMKSIEIFDMKKYPWVQALEKKQQPAPVTLSRLIRSAAPGGTEPPADILKGNLGPSLIITRNVRKWNLDPSNKIAIVDQAPRRGEFALHPSMLQALFRR